MDSLNITVESNCNDRELTLDMLKLAVNNMQQAIEEHPEEVLNLLEKGTLEHNIKDVTKKQAWIK